jgi:hypothetical protein
MRFTFLSVACLLGSAITAPIPVEQAASSTAVVDSALRGVANALRDLDSAMRSRPPGGSAEEASRITDYLLNLSNNAIIQLRNGANDVRSRQANLGALEGLSLTPTLNTMTSQLQNVMSGWTDSKAMVIAAGKYDVTLSTLYEAADRTVIFADSIINKLPWGEQTLGGTYKTQFTKIFDNTIKVWQRRY